MLTTRIEITKAITNHMIRNQILATTRKNMKTTKDSVTEIHISDLYTSIEIEDNDSTGWRSILEIPSNSEDSGYL